MMQPTSFCSPQQDDMAHAVAHGEDPRVVLDRGGGDDGRRGRDHLLKGATSAPRLQGGVRRRCGPHQLRPAHARKKASGLVIIQAPGSQQSRHHLDLPPRHRQRRDHRHRPCAPRADGPRRQFAPALTPRPAAGPTPRLPRRRSSFGSPGTNRGGEGSQNVPFIAKQRRARRKRLCPARAREPSRCESPGYAAGGCSGLRRRGLSLPVFASASTGRSASPALLPRLAQKGGDPLPRDAEAFGDLVHCQAFGVQRVRLGAAHACSTDVKRR